MLKLTLLCLLFVPMLYAEGSPRSVETVRVKEKPHELKTPGGKTDPEEENKPKGKTDSWVAKGKDDMDVLALEKPAVSSEYTVVKRSETNIHGEGYMTMNPEAGFHGGDGCLAKMDCATDRLPEGSDIVSVRLYHEMTSDRTKIHTLLAKADDQSQMMFRDHVQMANAGAFVPNNQAPVCPGTRYCMGTTTYFIYPIQQKDLGEYMCETRVRSGYQTLLYVGRQTLAFDRCCKACPYCSTRAGGVWGSLGDWSPEQCKGCVQERRPARCLTKHCRGPTPVQSRRCSQDGVCDETVRIAIHTERDNEDRCRAKIQCKVPHHVNVTSVQLFHVWGPSKAVKFTGYTDVEYSGSILLAEATAGVNGGRFTEKVSHANGRVDLDIPSDPQLCSCTDNCREYYTYTFDTVKPADLGDYACVIHPRGGTYGFDYAARLSFSDDCPWSSKETVRVKNCEEYCLKRYLVEGSHEDYVRFMNYYCDRLCTWDDEADYYYME